MVREAKEVANTASGSGELTLALSVQPLSAQTSFCLERTKDELWVVGGGEGMRDWCMYVYIFFNDFL